MWTIWPSKVAQKFGYFWDYFDKRKFLSKNSCGYFLGDFWKKSGSFLIQQLVTLVVNLAKKLKLLFVGERLFVILSKVRSPSNIHFERKKLSEKEA